MNEKFKQFTTKEVEANGEMSAMISCVFNDFNRQVLELIREMRSVSY